MRVFLYEFITGGGMFSLKPDEVPSGSLLREGAAMLTALAKDLASIPGAEVLALLDDRLAIEQMDVHWNRVRNAQEESARFDSLTTASDWTIVIAPEFDEILLGRSRRVEELGGRLLGPSSAIVALATYKDKTASHLKMRGIRTPRGYRFSAGTSIPATLRFPAVLKPNDGAGSQGLLRIENRESFPELSGGTFRLEELQRGTAASVAVLCGPNSSIALPACRQLLADDGTFAYLGGEIPLDRPLRDRAERLALQAAATFADCLGYIGIDMVLGSSAELDVVIEVNPRLTTSYVGLRRLSRSNLASAMIDVARGETFDLDFASGPVEFQADGTILGD